MMRPHPPRFLMKRRKTVSVTPAMGASTVAGAMRTLPIVRIAGNGRDVMETADWPVRRVVPSALSQNLLTPLFYVLWAFAQLRNEVRNKTDSVQKSGRET